jgi:hypothetical protein
VLDYTVMNGVLPDCKFGFRSRHSTCHQVGRLTKKIRRGFQKRLSLGMLLLDIEKRLSTRFGTMLLYIKCLLRIIRIFTWFSGFQNPSNSRGFASGSHYVTDSIWHFYQRLSRAKWLQDGYFCRWHRYFLYEFDCRCYCTVLIWWHRCPPELLHFMED